MGCAKILVCLMALPVALIAALIGGGLVQNFTNAPNWVGFVVAAGLLFLLYKGALQ